MRHSTDIPATTPQQPHHLPKTENMPPKAATQLPHRRRTPHQPLPTFPAQPTSRLLSLPREISEIIYTYALSDLPTRFTILSNNILYPRVISPQTLPPFTFACRQVHHEVIIAYISRTRFVFTTCRSNGIEMFYHLLERIPGGYKAVRMLGWNKMEECKRHNWSGPEYLDRPPSCAWDLVRRCPGLTSLYVSSLGNNLRIGFSSDSSVDSLGYGDIVKVPNLRRLDFTCMSRWSWEETRSDGEPTRKEEVDKSRKAIVKGFLETRKSVKSISEVGRGLNRDTRYPVTVRFRIM
jgi:hypothetical protein